jgi:ketosteroid isomerase-like protein
MNTQRLGWAATFVLVVAIFGGMATPVRASSADEIKAIQLSIAAAAERRDLDGIMSHYLPGDKLFVFDMYPPRAYIGWEAFRGDWKNFLDALQGPISYKLDELVATSDGQFGYTHMIQYIRGTSRDGKPFTLNLRETDVYRKINGKWMIVHVHASVPVDLTTEQGDFLSRWSR